MCTKEEIQSFITSGKKSRENWITVAKKSWDEIKKRQSNGKLWAMSHGIRRKNFRYPAWYSIFKIRQGLVLSRAGIPLGKDTSQSGADSVGQVSAVLIERLAKNMAKSFDFFDVLSACRDDFLATNFSTARAYYEKTDIKERVKNRITPTPDPTNPESMFFADENGEEVLTDDIYQDDEGYFIYKNQVVDIENECIYLEHVNYDMILIDPDCKRYSRAKRLAFGNYYSPVQFKRIFGSKAASQLLAKRTENGDDDSKKEQRVVVWEYWDMYEKECYWYCEECEELLTPDGYYMPDPTEDEWVQPNGLYNLSGFFPCPKPLIMNNPTDEFWPVPEYYQLFEILEEIHTIFSRMMALTRAIRVRLLFDDGVDSLKSLINEASEGDAIGVPNLTQSLLTANGDITNVVQYLPIAACVEGLNNLSIELDKRLNMIYRLTGTSDMLQGIAQDQTQRTAAERQMTEKYALNQLSEPQKKMQEFVRDCYQLLTEMALNNFTDDSLERYIIPQTLQPKQQEMYQAALGLLKDDPKRFRIELETDSTIALNEQYDQAMRKELANVCTAALEHTAEIAASNPALARIELNLLKYLVQGFRQGKLFQNEITDAIDQVMEQMSQQEPAFDAAKAKNELEMAKAQTAHQLEEFKILSDGQLKQQEMAQNERLAGIKAQLESFKIQAASQQNEADNSMELQKLYADIQKSRESLAVEREKLMIEYQKIAGEKGLKEYQVMLEERFGTIDRQLMQAEASAKLQIAQSSEAEKLMTERRLQQQFELEQIMTGLEISNHIQDQQANQAQVQIQPTQPNPQKVKKSQKLALNDMGQVVGMENTEELSG